MQRPAEKSAFRITPVLSIDDSTKGAPLLGSLQGWEPMLLAQLASVISGRRRHADAHPVPIPAQRQKRKR
jgi:hypothetical protein